MALTPSTPARFPATTESEVMTLRHRAFDITIRTMRGRYGDRSYSYAVLHFGHVLHETAGDFGSASAADKAARQLIDDALQTFEHSISQLEPNEA